MKIYASIRTGKSHIERGTACDDRILIGKKLLSEGYFETEVHDIPLVVAVADGVGNSKCGWKAAESALGYIAEWASEFVTTEDGPRELFEKANDVVAQIRAKEEWRGTSTTLSMLVLTEEEAKVFHAGDSRVYQQREVQGYHFFRQITADQDMLNRWILEEQGVTKKQLKSRVGWNWIWGYLGMPAEKFADTYATDSVVADGRFILTTDGIHDFLEKKEFEKLLTEEKSWRERLEAIMHRAVENGSSDDQSVIVVEYE